MQEEYFIGLDVGTNSVGWAVTDTQYNLLKCNGKSLWGARLFDPAQSAADRRSFRTARRRQKRSQQRLQWLEAGGGVLAGNFKNRPGLFPAAEAEQI